MFTQGDFPIGSDSNWWYLLDRRNHTTVRKFRMSLWSIDKVRLYRHGYIAGLNSK